LISPIEVRHFSTAERIMTASGRLRRVCGAVVFAGLLTIPAVPAFAQALAYMPFDRSTPAFPQYAPQPQQPDDATPGDELPTPLRRQVVAYQTTEPAGTIIIDTAHTFLYLTLGDGNAMRYGIGVGREGFTWSGVETIRRKAEWPDWIPPAQMVARQPYLPRWVGGGPGNPLGARALYLGNTDYRIHGTNDPTTIGKHVSSGCIRLQNADVIDLYERVGIGTKVVVLPNDPRSASIDDGRGANLTAPNPATPITAQIQVRPAAPMRYSTSGLY
jgi:lipoprotein-anchoring transpeptidase ErfK/SrfK